jgi:hypothetical protein
MPISHANWMMSSIDCLSYNPRKLLSEQLRSKARGKYEWHDDKKNP